MKSIVNEAKSKLKLFPKLMIGPDGSVILARLRTSAGCIEGIQLDSINEANPGNIERYSEEWSDSFKDFEGSVTLSNE